MIVRTLESTPKDATHWSTRSMANRAGPLAAGDHADLAGVWLATAPAGHLEADRRTRYSSTRSATSWPAPEPARTGGVPCVDEKSQIQALDRTAPVFPILPGIPARRPMTTNGPGTSHLYAALDLATGKVIGWLHCPPPSHRVQPVPADPRESRPGRPGRPRVLDNASTHKTPAIHAGSSPTPGSTCTSRRPTPPG